MEKKRSRKGVKKSEAHKASLSKANDAVKKSVIQMDMEGNYIATHNSITDAGRALGLKPNSRGKINASKISQVCNGQYGRVSFKGFKWDWEDESLRPVREGKRKSPDGMKYCVRCEEDKSLDEFGANKNSKDGKQTYCKSCRSGIKRSEKDKRRRNESVKERRVLDSLYRLNKNVRVLIKSSFDSKGFKKNTKTERILGCTWEEFKTHLNNNTYGFTIEDRDMDLDHIVPISSAKTEEEVYKLNHYTNFQLLPSEYNRKVKVDKEWNQKHFEEWLANR